MKSPAHPATCALQADQHAGNQDKRRHDPREIREAVPAVLAGIAGGKAQHLERENGEHAGHGIEDKTSEKGQPQRQQKGHIGTSGGRVGDTRSLRLKRRWRNRTGVDIYQQMLGLGRVAEPRICTALISHRKRQLRLAIGQRDG